MIGGVMRGIVGGIGVGEILLLVLFLLLPYFLPSIVASRSGHKSTLLIILSNILFAWTGIGWLIILIWAAEGGKKSALEKLNRETWKINQPLAKDSKKCPICAETIKLAALKCRFCGEDFGKDGSEIDPKKQTIKDNIDQVIETRKEELKCLYCGVQLPKLSPSAYCSEEHCTLFLNGNGSIIIDGSAK
jgi:hypothetical protein